jgi:hypothetical protein
LTSAATNGVISPSLEVSLRDLMGFRHFYRHSYSLSGNSGARLLGVRRDAGPPCSRRFAACIVGVRR